MVVAENLDLPGVLSREGETLCGLHSCLDLSVDCHQGVDLNGASS